MNENEKAYNDVSEAEKKRLREENERLKGKLRNCVCPHCGFLFDQALKGD